MHLILIRHCSRIDKSKRDRVHTPGFASPTDDLPLPSPSWLANFDPPLDIPLAAEEMSSAMRRISTHITPSKSAKQLKFVIHCSPFNRCIQTAELLLDHLLKLKPFNPDHCQIVRKLRIDQALSEWLSENFNLNYLPPNDDGYSMINNVNAYLNTDGVYGPSDGTILNSTTKGHLRDIRDPTWSYNELGHCSDYGEPPLDFKRRCFDYLTSLMQYYYRRQSYEADKDTVVFVISHGAVISTLLQMLLNRPVFNEIPLCTPVYFKQSDHRRTVFSLMDYDFDLNKILSFSSDRELFKLLQCPIDMSMMNFENSANELTIGTSDYTTIIQSPPQPGRSRSSSGSASKKPRSNTISLGEPQESLDDSEKTNLRQTRSSKQLHVMNTGDDRSIDLDKLASYFDNYSDSGSGSDEEEEGTDERESDISSPGSPPPQVPRIPSLSSLNALMHTNSAANSIKDMLVDPSATSQTRSSLASAFLMELFGSDSQSPLNDNSSIPETLLSNQTLGGFHLGDEGITDSEDEEDLRSSTTEEGGVLSFGEAKETAMNERKKKVRVFEGTFAKVAFNSKEDEEEDKENGVVEMGKSRSQIMLLSTLENTKGNDESGVVVQKKGGEELKKILFGSDSSDEDDEWFGSNLPGEPASDLLG